MGKTKTVDKSSLSGNFCKTNVKRKGDNALHCAISKRSRSDYVKLPKNPNDETFHHQSAKVNDAMPMARENRATSSRSLISKMSKGKIEELKKENSTLKAKDIKEMVLSSLSGSDVASNSKSEVTNTKQLVSAESFHSQGSSDIERLKHTGIPTVHIQRLNSTEHVLLYHSEKQDSVDRKSAKNPTDAEATYLPESQSKNRQLLDSSHYHEISIKGERNSSLAVDNQRKDTLKIKSEKDCVDDDSAQVIDVAGAKRGNSAAISLLTKFDYERMSPKRLSDSLQTKCCYVGGGEGLTEDKPSNVTVKNTAAIDDDIVVLSVDSSRSKPARKSRSDMNRKRSGTDEINCGVTMHIKQEPCEKQNGQTSDISVDKGSEGFTCDTPKKVTRTSCQNVGAKSAKKTRPTKSRQSTPNVALSILTRSMIKIPGMSTSSMFEATNSVKKRRVTETEIWLNRRLEQQACLLWSSEQKRRFQQQYPDSPSDVIDDAMRRHWESLGDRDRHRYLQRARSAMAVERGRQLGRRGLSQHSARDENSTTDSLARRLEHCNAEQLSTLFDSATAEQKADIIRHKLRALQRRLAPEDYAALTHLFRDNLRLAADHPPPGTSPRQAADANRGTMESLARRVMFTTVRGVESCVQAIQARRRASVAQQTVIQYHALLSALINHAVDSEVLRPIDDDEDCFSLHLDQLLQDLADVDRGLSDGGDCAGWSDGDQKAVLAMATELSLGWFAGSTTLSLAGQPTVVPNVVDLCCQKMLLYSATMSPSVVPLSVVDVDEQLMNISQASGTYTDQPSPPGWSVANIILAETAGNVYRLRHGLERCCGLDSPSCVLSGLVVYDRLCRLRQQGGPGPQQLARRSRVVDSRGQTAADTTETRNNTTDWQQSACQ